MRRVIIAVGLFTAVAIATVTSAQAGSSGAGSSGVRPPPVFALSSEEVVKASQGSYCWSAGPCADYAYPLQIRKRLEVHRGSHVALRLGTEARRLYLRLLRVEGRQIQTVGRAFARPTSERRRRWSTRLPANLNGANTVDLSIIYSHNRGGSNVWIGLR